MIPEPAVTVEQFIASADEALYQAKARGRNQIVAASELHGHQN